MGADCNHVQLFDYVFDDLYNLKVCTVLLISVSCWCYIVAPSKADVSLINKRLHSQLVSVQSDIEVLRRDPKSPLYHAKTFEALNLYV